MVVQSIERASCQIVVAIPCDAMEPRARARDPKSLEDLSRPVAGGLFRHVETMHEEQILAVGFRVWHVRRHASPIIKGRSTVADMPKILSAEHVVH